MAEDDSGHQIYLSDISEKDKPWDTHRAASDRIKQLYQEAGYGGYAGRIQQCSTLLGFALSAMTEGEFKLKLQEARFCRVRHCPTCQWRRSLKWRAKFFKALPKISEDYPTVRWVFLSLTLRNCHLDELRDTLKLMGQAWQRMTQRKSFPAIGWVRSVEVTRSKDGTAHPHYHCLLAVPASYFGRWYLKQSDWAEMWRQALRVSYTPIMHVTGVKARHQANGGDAQQQLFNAICETLKYAVKEADLAVSAAWLAELTEQLHKTRAIATGGILKEYLADDDDEESENLIHIEEGNEEPASEDDLMFWFGWREMVKRYAKQ